MVLIVINGLVKEDVMILIVLLYAILALTFIFAKYALFYAKPFFLIGIRMMIAGSLLFGYQYLFRRQQFVMRRQDWWLFFKVSLFHIYFAFTLEFFALQYLTALKTTIIYSATPFISAILAHILLNEKLNKQKIIGVICGLCGLVPVIMAQSTGSEIISREFFCISYPEAILCVAVVCAAYAWFLVMDLMRKGYELGMINGVAMMTGGVLSMVTACFVEGLHAPVTEWMPFIGWLALLIISANFIVYNLYGALLRRHSIILVSFAGWLCPSFAALYEWLFLGGTITWHYGASLFFVALGLFLFYRNDLKNKA